LARLDPEAPLLVRVLILSCYPGCLDFEAIWEMFSVNLSGAFYQLCFFSVHLL
jgi:hypothetical protein